MKTTFDFRRGGGWNFNRSNDLSGECEKKSVKLIPPMIFYSIIEKLNLQKNLTRPLSVDMNCISDKKLI